MSSFDLLNIALVALEVSTLGYAAFWARNVREALAIGVYRGQAFGIVLIAITLALEQIGATISAYFVYHDPLQAFGNGGFGLFFIFLIALFYWVDASAFAARRSDPLSRDNLHWSKVRIVLWAGTLPAAIIVILVSIVSLISSGGNSGVAPSWATLFLIPGIFIPLISCAVVLPVIAFRTHDKLLRNHFKWFGLFGIIYLAFNQITGILPNITLALLLIYVGNIIGAYCLYRSALSLTPLENGAVVKSRFDSMGKQNDRT
jgi:hypothetical protein